jgi:nucleotide sugar dehydrogenase
VLEFDAREDLAEGNGVWDLGSAEAAEMAKLAETTYRDVNIALANQFALHAHDVGVDIYKVIEACNSQPYSHIHQPGISVGGHCIPVYPRLYLSTDKNSEVVRAARELNSSMPARLTDKFASLLGDISGRTILILGATYRSGVKETAFSGVFSISDRLNQLGANCVVLDPLYSPEELRSLGLEPLTDCAAVTGLILNTAHEQFLSLSISDFPNLQVVLDGRNFLKKKQWSGRQFFQLGKPISLNG